MREEFFGRPMVVAFCGLAAGLASGYHWTNALFGLIFLPLVWKKPAMIVLGVAMLTGVMIRPQPPVPVVVEGGVLRGPVLVLEVPATERDSLSAVVEHKGKRYRLRLPDDSDVNLGDKIFVSATILPLSQKAQRPRLEVAQLRPLKPPLKLAKGAPLWRWGLDVRRSFLGFVRAHADARLVGYVEALTFNVMGDIGDDSLDNLRRSGTIHIVSASGLHVTVVSFALAWLLLALSVPRWMQLSLLGFFLFVYAAAAGFHPPMVRAIMMVFAGSFAYAFSREPDALSALALSGVTTLLIEHEAIASLGFQLSYLAVSALILFGGFASLKLEETLLGRFRTSILLLVRTGLIAALATGPLLGYQLGQISVVSVLSNLLVVSVVPFVVVGALAGWLTSFLWLGLGVGILKFVVEPLTAWIYASVEVTGSWGWSVLKVPQFSPYWIVAFYCCLALLYRHHRRPADVSTVW